MTLPKDGFGREIVPGAISIRIHGKTPVSDCSISMVSAAWDGDKNCGFAQYNDGRSSACNVSLDPHDFPPEVTTDDVQNAIDTFFKIHAHQMADGFVKYVPTK